MPSYASGDLVWDTTEPKAPRWVLVLDGPPGAARRRVDPHDPATPQAASTSQLRELIHQAFHADTGHWPVSVTLAAVRYKLRQLLDLYIGIPALKHSAQCAVERLGACLQQQMRAPFAPLHLPFFAEAFAHDLVHHRLHKACRNRLAVAIPHAVIRDQVAVVHDIRAELFYRFAQLFELWMVLSQIFI